MGQLLLRLLVGSLAAVVLAGAVCCAYLLVCALRPRPGASMALMGVPALSLPMAVSSLAIVGIVLCSPATFAGHQRAILIVISALGAVPLIVLALLG